MPFAQPLTLLLGFPGGSAGKESACNAGNLGSIPGLGRSPGEGKGYPLYYSGLENSMDCIVHVVAKSWTRLSDFHNSTSSQLSCGNNNTDVIEIVKIHEVSTCLSVVEWKAVQSFYELGSIYIFCLGEKSLL